MKRKILSLALVLAMVLSMLPMLLMTASAEVVAPTTLPDGKGYTTLSIFSDPTKVIAMNDANSTAGKWLATTSAADIGNGFNNGVGIMFKVDASEVASGDDWLNLCILMSITGNNGTAYKMVGHSGGVNGYYSSAQNPTTPSTWYISKDGAAWTELTDENNSFRKPVTNHRGVTYVYVPYSAMYMTVGETKITTGTDVTTETGMSFLDAKTAVGGWANAANSIQFFQDGSNAMTAATVSEVNFVFEKADPSEMPLTAPTTLPNGNAYVPYSFFSSAKVLTYGSDYNPYSAWLEMDTVANTTALNGNGGVMFKVDATAAAAGDFNFAFHFTVTGNNGVVAKVASHGDAARVFNGAAQAQYPTSTSTWYISKDGESWTTYEAPASGGVVVTKIAEQGDELYVYIPYSSMYLTEGKTFMSGGARNTAETAMNFLEARELVGGWKAAGGSLMLCSTGSATGTVLSEFQFVTEPTTVDAPSTLPDGKEFATESLFSNPDQTIALNGSQVNTWIGTTSAEVLGDGFNNALGIMFKIDASEVAAGTDVLSLMIMMSITGNTTPTGGAGANNVMLHSGGVRGYYADAQKPTPSTWYISTDGGEWTAITDDANGFCKPVTGVRGVTYVYVPFSEMYMRSGETYYKTGTSDPNEAGMNFLDAKKLFGGWANAANNVQIRPAGGAMTGATFSEFSFVYGADPLIDTEAGIFESVNITATNDIAYNLYAKIPAGATNVNMSFLFNGKTYNVVGVAQEDGTVKYTLDNVLPQYMAQDIVATWTATVDGVTVTDTYTMSVEEYLKAVLAGKHYTDMHDISTALLHYGAAAQAVAGNTDAAVNTDVPEIAWATTREELPATYQNGNTAVWTSAALRLESTIEFKIGVTAPAGITQVQYTIGDKTEVVTIKNGYVYIPVNAYQMMDPITLNCYDGSVITADGALTISASYYLKTVNTDDTKMDALLVAIANYAAQATIAVGGREGSINKAYSTVAQMALLDDFGGMSNVIQLTDGSFIIIDGGTMTDANEELLWTYLWRNSGYTKPVISAWIFTHLDLDHTGLGFAFLTKHKNDITVKTIGYTFPDNYQTLFAIKDGDDENTKQYKNSAISLQTERLAAFESIKKAHPEAALWDMEKGDVKSFADVSAKVLLSANEITTSNPFEHNQASAIIQFTFTQNTVNTNDDKTYMVFGDSTPDRLQTVAAELGAALKSDVMQATHHGLYGGYKPTYELVDPDISLLPVWEAKLKDGYKENESDTYGMFWTVDYNAYLLENSDCYFHDDTTVVNMADLSVSIWK